MARRALLVTASLVLALALAEGLLRLAWTNPYRGERPERLVRLRLQHALRDLPIDRRALYPNAPLVRLRTDERSYLLPSRRFERPDATIAFLGGSTTECFIVSEELRFPALVSTLLEQRGVRVDVLNAAVSRATAHDALNVLVNHVAFDRPDVAVLMEAVNDDGLLSAQGSYASRAGEPLTAFTSLRWLAQAASGRSSLAGMLRSMLTPWFLSRGQGQQLAAPEPPRTQDYAARLRAFVRVARSLGIEPVLMTQPSSRLRNEFTPAWVDPGHQATFNDVVRGVATEEGATLIDLAAHVAALPAANEPMGLFYDGLHVTEEGSRRYAEHIAGRLLETVLRRGSR